MFEKLTEGLAFQSQALILRAERQRIIASNIANADTPGYVARDFNFREAMQQALGSTNQPQALVSSAHARHMKLGLRDSELGGRMGYAPATQPSMDNNTVDLDRERSNFTDNAVRYESTLRFINGSAKTMLTAIQGQ
jgi:flagellar basal-body rod protein FlgB